MTSTMVVRSESTEGVDLRPEQSLELVALDRPQLEAAHAQMIAWARERVATVRREISAEVEVRDIAKERKWAHEPHNRRIKIMERRIAMYEKIELALHAGYVIVPNFEMTVFAIRTKAKSPGGGVRSGHWNRFEQPAQALAAGEGDYKNPLPAVVTTQNEVTKADGKKEIAESQWADEFTDLEFPIALAKPALMTRTAEAMALKVFDEIGVAVDGRNGVNRRGGDPIILGRILNPRQGRPALTFFVGWYFDPSRI